MKAVLTTILLLFTAGLCAQFSPGVIDLGRDSMRYLVSYPEGYAQDTADWPLVLFLHGGGNSGSDLERVKESGLPRHISDGRRFPFVTLVPQNKYVTGFWDIVGLTHLLDEFVATNHIDTRRVYVTGFSRGGMATWLLAMHNQGRFAAIAPVCGAVPDSYHVWIPDDLPVWVFHGTDDQSIYPSESIDILARLRARGLKPKLTMYEGVAHDAWVRAYAEPELYEWLLAQRLGARN